MLNQDDQRRLEQLARQLRAEDPYLADRIAGRPRRLPRWMVLVCVLIWAAAVGAAVVGWWLSAVVIMTMALLTTASQVYAARAHTW
jgi:uncharacterized membrane protein YjjP (DUF1212 family)